MPTADRPLVEAGLLTLLRAMSRSAEPFVRQAAATALGPRLATVPLDTLLTLARDRSWAVRQAAATALGPRLEPRALDTLLTLAREDDDSFVRQALTATRDFLDLAA